MIVENDNKNLISKYIKGVNKRYLYRDINYDERGIDYTHFIKLRLTTFDKQHNFIEKFTPEGFRILWYLMTRAKQNTYINTDIKLIAQNLNMTSYKVIKGIQALQDINIIEIYRITESQQIYEVKKINVNQSLHILIKYHNDELYFLDEENGYKAIPFDFAYKAAIDLEAKEFTLLMFLIVMNRYYYVGEYIDPETGEILNKVNDVCYSFPTQEQMSKVINVSRNNINKYIDKLEVEKYIKINKTYEKRSIKDKATGKQKIKNMNFTYEVILLNRFEYIKYQIVDIANKEIDKLPIKLKNYIKKNNIDNILIEDSKDISIIVKNKLYLEQKYGQQIIDYYKEYK